uniref:GA2ox4 n=1 Tax=Liriodendron chinense TaxID=3414 RepID=A0A977Q7Q5_LIRCH|nr:GA2ox4 [Liriodendron chinense]
MASNPPFQNAYKILLETSQPNEEEMHDHSKRSAVVDGSDLPLIDLSPLSLSDGEKEACKRQIVEASTEWGFFQVKNHGISREILEKIRREQMKLFLQPFEKKAKEKVLDFSADCYRWGTPTAMSLKQFSWSEAFHIPLVRTTDAMDAGEFSGLRSRYFRGKADREMEMEIADHVFCVAEMQAWSNGAYKSVEHRVMTNTKAERYSVAYFMCPSYDTVIESCIQPSMYRKFSFREYRQQVQDDVRTTGSKVGLPRFLI